MSQGTQVRAVRFVGMLEGLSYVLLLFVAMPLKYAMDMPMAVRIVGGVHGALFVLLGCLVIAALYDDGLRRREAFMVAIASLVPFGPLFIDGRLREAVARASHERE